MKRQQSQTTGTIDRIKSTAEPTATIHSPVVREASRLGSIGYRLCGLGCFGCLHGDRVASARRQQCHERGGEHEAGSAEEPPLEAGGRSLGKALAAVHE